MSYKIPQAIEEACFVIKELRPSSKVPQAIEKALTRHYNIYPEAEVYKVEARIFHGPKFVVFLHAAHFNVPLRYDITL